MIKTGLNEPVISTFVNNIKIMAPKNNWKIERGKLELSFTFSKIDIGPISFYLGLKIQQDGENQMIKLS